MRVTSTSRDNGKVNQIVTTMHEHLGSVMNLARIKLLAFMIHALCVVYTVSLHNKVWVEYLNNMRIRYYLRIKQNFWLRNPKSSGDVRAWHHFHVLKLGQECHYDKLFLLKGEYVYIAGALLKNSDGVPELQILICYNKPKTLWPPISSDGRLRPASAP